MNSIDAGLIMERARVAQGTWVSLAVSRRSAVVRRLRHLIADQCESIAELIANETSKPILDALSGDVLVTLEMMRYYETRGAAILDSRRIGKPSFFFSGTRFEAHFEPQGVALIFGPSNYPFQLTMVPLITALIAGNAVILKCSEGTPRTAELIADLCSQADLPRDLVQVSCDRPEEATGLIDACPDVIFFTGSSRHGQEVAERAAKHLIPVILELGGKDAAIVFADCNLERAVNGITYGAFANGGRVCVGIKRALIEASIYDDCVERLKRRIASLSIGFSADCDICPLTPGMRTSVRDYVEDAVGGGATLHYPLKMTDVGETPLLLSGVSANSRLLTEETFGPVLCVAPFKDEAEAVALANQSSFALSSSVWTRDRAKALRVTGRVSAGSCAVNDVIRVIANPYAAFGGNQESGYGRYHGPEGLRSFSRVKTVMFARDRGAREVNWFPFTNRTRRQLTSLLRTLHCGPGLLTRLRHLLAFMLLCVALGATPHLQSQSPSQLSIRVRLTPDAHGEIGYLVFNSASGFPGEKKKAIRHGFVSIPSGVGELHFDNVLPSGTYAVSVYEDLNGNHKLDRNIVGIPTEPVGVSNNPTERRRTPRFEECAFHLGAAPQTITIAMVRGS